MLATMQLEFLRWHTQRKSKIIIIMSILKFQQHPSLYVIILHRNNIVAFNTNTLFLHDEVYN